MLWLSINIKILNCELRYTQIERIILKMFKYITNFNLKLSLYKLKNKHQDWFLAYGALNHYRKD